MLRVDWDFEQGLTEGVSQIALERAAEVAFDAARSAAAGTGLATRAGDWLVAVRVVADAEMAELNLQFRGKPNPTNVLSFPAEPLPAEIAAEFDELPLGDLAIAVDVIKREAAEQGKPLVDHWTHMLVHGVLHLIGYDHVDESDAKRMEALEIDILASLGIPDPY